MPIITRAKRFTETALRGLLVALATAVWWIVIPAANAGWSVDFSRRMQSTRTQDLKGATAGGELPVSVPAATANGISATGEPAGAPVSQQPPGFFESLFQTGEVAQEIVVLNTDKGFVPSTIRVKKGLNYRIHVVNVNDKERNVSFVLDSFSEHHATYYGKIKSFVIHPVKEGVYKFVSPETAAQGKLVVFPAGSNEVRAPASAE